MIDFKVLKNLTFSKVYRDKDCDVIIFERINGKGNKSGFALYHEQDCCENVYIESIVGDLSDLENTPILQADVGEWEYGGDQGVFYKIATIKGYVDIRFYQESGSYYSIAVSLVKLSNCNIKDYLK